MITINDTQNCNYFHPLKILSYSERFNLDSVLPELFSDGSTQCLNYSLPHGLVLEFSGGKLFF